MMIKTLRIAGVLTAVMAVVLLALPVVFGSGNGKDSNKLIDTETIIEKFKKIRESQTRKNEEQISPLVKEANDFALYLNPPAPKITTMISQDPVFPPPPQIVQFKLISTCVHQTSPELSLALVDQPGEGLHWVRPSDKIGHFVVKEVQSGLLIVNDGQKNVEVKIETVPTFESLVSSNSTPNSSLQIPVGSGLLGRTASGIAPLPATRTGARNSGATSVPPMPASGVRTKPGFNGPMTMPTMPSTRSSAGSSQNTTQVNSAEEEAAAQELMSQLDAALVGAGIGENATEEDMKKADEIVGKYFNEIDNMQISGQEAQKISDLGKQLDKDQGDPNRTKTPTTVKSRPRTQTPK